MSVQATARTVQPGQTAQYAINVQPIGGVADDVTVQISVTPSSFPKPDFSICGAGDGTPTCKIGVLRAKQPTELQATVSVPKSASSGETATLTATVTGVAKGATTQGSVSAIGSVRVVAPSTSPTPTPTKTSSGHAHGHRHHHSSSGGNSGGSGSGSDSGVGTSQSDTSPLGGLPPLTGTDSTGSGANPGNLFPTINPSTSPSGSASPTSRALRGPYRPTTVADVVPLNTTQVGSQLAGLIVLAIGIAIAVVRVSLRKPRTQGKP